MLGSYIVRSYFRLITPARPLPSRVQFNCRRYSYGGKRNFECSSISLQIQRISRVRTIERFWRRRTTPNYPAYISYFEGKKIIFHIGPPFERTRYVLFERWRWFYSTTTRGVRSKIYLSIATPCGRVLIKNSFILNSIPPFLANEGCARNAVKDRKIAAATGYEVRSNKRYDNAKLIRLTIGKRKFVEGKKLLAIQRRRMQTDEPKWQGRYCISLLQRP